MVEKKNYELMKSFTLKNIPELDICVLGALEFFSGEKPPKVNIPNKKIIVVGSGNAIVTGKILFDKYNAVFADESTYKSELKKSKFDLGVIVSASGGKHAPIIAKAMKSKKIKSFLLTTNKDALAKPLVSKTYVFPKQREPYTYNTSTFLSMILGMTKENLSNIYSNLKKLRIPNNLKKYDAIYITVPDKFNTSREMFQTKFDELFGPMVVGRVFTLEQTKHAKTLIPSDKELFISFGEKNNTFGKNRLFVPLSKNANFAEMIATGYYVIGKIQKQKPDYFKKNVAKYCAEASKIFKQKINPIVE